MRHLFFILLFLVACEEIADLADEESLIRICVDDNGVRSCSTGFFISKNEVMTSAHILYGHDQSTWEVYGSYGDRLPVIEGDVDRGEDIALITLDVANGYYFDFCPNAHVLDDVYIIDFHDGELVYDEGWITLTNVYFRGWLRLTAKAERGYSGGPIVDSEQGCIRGMVKARTKTDHDAIGPSVEILRDFVNRGLAGAGRVHIRFVQR